MRRLAAIGVFLALGSACSTTSRTIATPIPSLEPISDFFARLSPRPSVSPPTSPSPSAAAQSASGNSAATSRPGAPRASSPAASSRVSCPSGRVTAEVTDVSASDTGDPPSSNGDRRYDVSVSGTATNGANASVRGVTVSVSVHANNERATSYDVSVPQTIGPGQTVGWSGRFRYRGRSAPQGEGSYASVSGWSWANAAQSSCPV